MERPFGRGMHLQIEVQDVRALYQNFKKAEYPIFFDLEEEWYRVEDKEIGHKQFLVQDPDGYLLRFFEEIGVRPANQTDRIFHRSPLADNTEAYLFWRFHEIHASHKNDALP